MNQSRVKGKGAVMYGEGRSGAERQKEWGER